MIEREPVLVLPAERWVAVPRHRRYAFASIVDAPCFYDQEATYPLQM